MRKLSLFFLILLLCVLMPRETMAAGNSEERSARLFDNPEHIYEQFQDEIYNKEYGVKYGFAREEAYVYTDWYGSAVDGKVEKFTGVIVVSETESYAQVIYEKDEGYDIGWIEQTFYQEEVRFYYGAEKQLLADGIYMMESYTEDRTYYLELDSHPIPKRPTTPFGDWFQWTSLETGGLASSCYFIFEKTK